MARQRDPRGSQSPVNPAQLAGEERLPTHSGRGGSPVCGSLLHFGVLARSSHVLSALPAGGSCGRAGVPVGEEWGKVGKVCGDQCGGSGLLAKRPGCHAAGSGVPEGFGAQWGVCREPTSEDSFAGYGLRGQQSGKRLARSGCHSSRKR